MSDASNYPKIGINQTVLDSAASSFHDLYPIVHGAAYSDLLSDVA